jgi:predicted AAA+ superfamily ATPase
MNENMLQNLEAGMKRRILALPPVLRPFTVKERVMPRALVLTGQRGTGKTTFLLHHAGKRHFLYFSADNPLLSGDSLYEIVRFIFLQGFEGVIVDEVHFSRDWSLHLKALYDDFPDRFLWASDSSSLVLREGTGDLSRRFVSVIMPLLSFREFAALKTGKPLPVFNAFESIPVVGNAELLGLFREYKAQGTRPFFSEGDFPERMLGILEKTLHSDIPFFLPQITDGNIRLMNAIVGTLAKASIPRLQVRSLCADWNIGAEKLYQLLFVMESVGVVRIIRKLNDTKANTAGDKLFFGDPALYAVLDGDPGSAREAMVAAMLGEAGMKVESTRDETTGDFIVEGKIAIEIGGASKKIKKADFVIQDDIDLPAGKALPLWSLGFMY